MTLAEITAALLAREPIFHQPEFGTDRAAFDGMMAPDYWEVGASGRVYSRAFVLDLLVARHARPHEDFWTITDSACRELAADNYLFTYVLHQGRDGERRTRRATLWQRRGADWLILYHQGTLIEPGITP